MQTISLWKIHFLTTLFILCAIFSGCTQASVGFRADQSHFTFPRADLHPIGPAQGSASKTGTRPLYFDQALERQAIEDALRTAGGDVLINYQSVVKTKLLFTLVFVSFYKTTATVHGTACAMTAAG